MLKSWASFFTLHCSSSLNCINEYLTIDSGGYMYEQPSRINCSIWLDDSQRSRDGVWVNRSVREVKCKALWMVLRYIRTCLLCLYYTAVDSDGMCCLSRPRTRMKNIEKKTSLEVLSNMKFYSVHAISMTNNWHQEIKDQRQKLKIKDKFACVTVHYTLPVWVEL